MNPGDNCAFCLAALSGAAGTLVLPCGHAFHATCALQFLLKRKQCIVCRAPVDESRVLDASQLPPEAAGRQFVPPPSTTSASGQHGGGADKSGSGGSGGGGSAPQIEMRAFAGSSAAAAASSASQLHETPPAPGSEYLPGYLSPSPRAASLGQAEPAPFVGVLVEGAPQPPLASQPPQPLHTITVVRPRHWPRRLLFFGIFCLLLAVVIAVPVIVARSGTSSGGSHEPTKEECFACLSTSEFDCPRGCKKYFPIWRDDDGDD